MPTRPNRDPSGEWKAIVLSYNEIFSLSTKKCSYCLTEQQASAIMQIAEYFAWQTRWIDAPEGKNNQLLRNFADGIIRELMSGCCGDELINYRIDEDGNLERSDDGGITYYPVPNEDPRVVGTIYPPLTPIEGQDMQCIAAENVVQYMQGLVTKTVDQMSAGGGITGIIAAIAAIVVLYVGITATGGLATPLLIGLASTLILTTGEAFNAAMTEDVYDRLRCNIFCNSNSDGSVDEAQWQTIKDTINSDETGIAARFLHDNINTLGVVGLTNVMRSGGASSADCEDCDCPTACAANFIAWPTGGNPGATDIVYDGDYIEFNLGTDYGYIAYPGGCCYVGSMDVISGTALMTAWSGCGGAYPPEHSTSPIGECCVLIEVQGSTYARVRIHMGDCS